MHDPPPTLGRHGVSVGVLMFALIVLLINGRHSGLWN